MTQSGHRANYCGHQRRAPVTVASSAFISCCGSAARITPPITAMPAGPSASTSAAIEAANSEDGDMRRSSDLRKPFAANLGTIARFARSLERRSRDRIIENARIDRLGFGDGVDRHADELVGS